MELPGSMREVSHLGDMCVLQYVLSARGDLDPRPLSEIR